MPTLMIKDKEMKYRKTITRPLKPSERRDGRLNVSCETLKDFVDGEDSIEVIVIKGGSKKV